MTGSPEEIGNPQVVLLVPKRLASAAAVALGREAMVRMQALMERKERVEARMGRRLTQSELARWSLEDRQDVGVLIALAGRLDETVRVHQRGKSGSGVGKDMSAAGLRPTDYVVSYPSEWPWSVE